MIKRKKGFTLIELLIVVAIIAILAAVVFVILRPQETLEDSRDARRWEDVRAILDAVHYNVVRDGDYPNSSSWVAGNYYILGTQINCDDCDAVSTQNACLNLTDLVNNYHIAGIPYDPTTGSTSYTDYYVYRNSGGVVEVGACDPENATEIMVQR